MSKRDHTTNALGLEQREELAEKITKEILTPEIPGVLITGISGTGLRYFCDSMLGEPTAGKQTPPRRTPGNPFLKRDLSGKDFRTYITVPMLPAHSLQDTLITTIQFITEYAIELIERHYSTGFAPLKPLRDNPKESDDIAQENRAIQQYEKRQSAFVKAEKIISELKESWDNFLDPYADEENKAEQAKPAAGSQPDETKRLIERISQLEGIHDFALLKKLAIARAPDQNLSVGALNEDSESESNSQKQSKQGGAKLDMFFSGLNLTANAASEKGKVIANTISTSLSKTYHPYTTALATSTLIDIFNELALFFNEMDSIAKDSRAKTLQPSRLTLVLHLERYPTNHVDDILGILREITRTHTDRFHIVATGGVDLYKSWKDSMQEPRSWLRSVFAKAYLLPPLMPWDLAKVILKDRFDDKAANVGRIKAYFGSGIINLTTNLMDGKDIKLIDYLAKSQSDGRQSNLDEAGKANACMDMFHIFLRDLSFEADPEKYFARVLFLYEILHEIEDRWQDLLIDGKINYYKLVSGSTVMRHEERGLGEPAALLISECITAILPSFQNRINGSDDGLETRPLLTSAILQEEEDWEQI